MPPRDKHEDEVLEQLESDGWDVITVGFPDIIALKDGKLRFIEVKTGHRSLNKAQKKAHNTFKKHGVSVEVIRVGGREDRTSISVSELTAQELKKMRRQKADGELETIEEVLIRLTRKGGVDLRGRKIALDRPE